MKCNKSTGHWFKHVTHASSAPAWIEVLLFDISSGSVEHRCVIFGKWLQVQAHLMPPEQSVQLLVPDPRHIPVPIMVSSSCFTIFLSVSISLSLFSILWHFHAASLPFLLMPYRTPLTLLFQFPVTDQRVTSGPLARGFRNVQYILTQNVHRSTQAISASLTVRRMRKVKNMKSHSNQDITSKGWRSRDAASRLQFTKSSAKKIL